MGHTAYPARIFLNDSEPVDYFARGVTTVPPSKTYEPVFAIASLYAVILLTYTSRSFTSFRQNHKLLVAFHTIVNLAEMAQYYTLPYRYPNARSTPVPITSVLLCLLQVHSSFELVRRLKRGNPAMVRASYQGGSILRGPIILAAYVLQSRTLHHDAVVLLHAFVYARLIVWVFSVRTDFPTTEISELQSLNSQEDKAVLKQLNEQGGMNKSLITAPQAYTAGVFGSVLIVMGHQEDEFLRRYGIMFLFLSIGTVLRLEQWVGDILLDYLQGQDITTPKQGVAWWLYKIGICRIPVLVQVDKVAFNPLTKRFAKSKAAEKKRRFF